MLTELCQELKNWFDVERKFDTFTVADGHITVDDLQDGQYFRIIGSVFNDGVHLSTDTLTDETFDGAVWLMAVPKGVLDLSDEIDAWVTANAAVAKSPYKSESFGGYSYSLKGGSSGGGGVLVVHLERVGDDSVLDKTWAEIDAADVAVIVYSGSWDGETYHNRESVTTTGVLNGAYGVETNNGSGYEVYLTNSADGYPVRQ